MSSLAELLGISAEIVAEFAGITRDFAEFQQMLAEFPPNGIVRTSTEPGKLQKITTFLFFLESSNMFYSVNLVK